MMLSVNIINAVLVVFPKIAKWLFVSLLVLDKF
jgi:hypothetical protein